MKQKLAFVLAVILLFCCAGCAASVQEEEADLAGQLQQALKDKYQNPDGKPSPDSGADADAQSGQRPSIRLPAGTNPPQGEKQETTLPVLSTSAPFRAEWIGEDSRYHEDGTYVESYFYGYAVYAQFCRFPGKYDFRSAVDVAVDFTEADRSLMKTEQVSMDPYSACRLSYTWGSNEDSCRCEDMIIITDDAMYLFHTKTNLEWWDYYESNVFGWIEGLYLQQRPEQAPYLGEVIELSEQMAGWWVCMGEDADPEWPIINCYTDDGKIFLSPEDYYAWWQGEEELYYCGWEVRNGEVIYLDTGDIMDEHPTVECQVVFEDPETMSVCWPDGVSSLFKKNTSREGSRFLKKGEYANLAMAPMLCIIGLEEDQPDAGYYFTIWADELIWVSRDDQELIEEYHLEDAPFFDDYELVDGEHTYHDQIVYFGDFANLMVIDWDTGKLELKKVTEEEFLKRLKEDHQMLVEITYEEGSITEIREVYVP